MSIARPSRILGSVVVTSLVTSLVAIAALAGCSGQSAGVDLTQRVDPTTPTDAGPDVIGCSAIAPVCNAGDMIVPHESCTDADGCYALPSVCGEPPQWCAHQTVQCGAVPRCDAGDTQVSVCPPPTPGPAPGGGYECYTRALCGSTIECVHSDQCDVQPVCNPGDVQVVDPGLCMNAAVQCYSVTSCGNTIECSTTAKPGG
jgi:hypothetical protein